MPLGPPPVDNHGAAIAAKSPSLWWRLDDVGSVAVDQAGNWPDVAINGSPTKGVAGLVQGPNQKAMTFNGTDSWINGGVDIPLGTAARTVSFWLDAKNSNTQQGIFVAGDMSGVGTNFEFVLTNDNGVGGASGPGINRAGLYISGNSNDVFIPDLYLGWGGPHHIAATLTGSTLNVWVDGKRYPGYVWNGTSWSARVNQPFTLPVAPNTTPGGLTFGWGNQLWGSGNGFFNGTLDEFCWFTRALTEAEVLDLFYSGGIATAKTRAWRDWVTSLANLRAWYRHDESGYSVYDVSGNGRHSTIRSPRGVRATSGAGDGDYCMSWDGTGTAQDPPFDFLSASYGATFTFGISFRCTVAGPILGEAVGSNPASLGNITNLYVDTAGAIRGQPCWGPSQLVATGDFRDNAWHRVVLAWAGGTETLYVDGTQRAQATGQTPSNYNPDTRWIGACWGSSGFPNEGVNGNYWWWHGYLDELVVLDRAMTAAEVATDWNNYRAQRAAPYRLVAMALLRTPAVTAGPPPPAAITPPALAARAIPRNPQVLPGARSIAPPTLAARAHLHLPSLTGGAVLQPPALRAVAAVAAPLVVPGPLTLTPPTAPALARLWPPSFRARPLELAPPALSAKARLWVPLVSGPEPPTFLTPGTLFAVAVLMPPLVGGAMDNVEFVRQQTNGATDWTDEQLTALIASWVCDDGSPDLWAACATVLEQRQIKLIDDPKGSAVSIRTGDAQVNYGSGGGNRILTALIRRYWQRACTCNRPQRSWGTIDVEPQQTWELEGGATLWPEQIVNAAAQEDEEY